MNKRRHSELLLGLPIALVLSASSTLAQTSAIEVPSPAPLPSSFPPALVTMNPLAYVEGGMRDELSQYFRANGGQDFIRLTRREFDPNAGQFVELHRTFSMPFALTSASAREGGDRLFLAGINRQNKTVLHRWKFRHPAKTRILRYQLPSAQPIGVPLPDFQSNFAIGTTSGVWESPLASIAPPIKEEIYSGNLAPFRSIAVDPEGRFILTLGHQTGKIHRIRLDVTPPSSPELLYDSGMLPRLDHATQLHFGMHEGVRKCVVSEINSSGVIPVGAMYTLLVDADNDGVFEGSEVLTAAQFSATTYQPIYRE